MNVVVPEIVPPQIPPEIPQPPGGVAEFLREAVALPGRFAGYLKDRVSSLSVAACMAWFVFFVLTGIVSVFWFGLRHDGDVPWQQTLTQERVGVCVLLLLIPLATYKVVMNWTEGVSTEFPDIQDAWNKGLTALRENNLDLSTHPLFLIVGSGDLRQEKSLMAAAGLQYVLDGIPPGPAPLHFYASKDSVYLVLSDTSWLSALVTLAGRIPASETAVRSQSLPGGGQLSSMDDFSRRTLDISTFMAQKEMEDKLQQQSLPGSTNEPTLKPGSLHYGVEDKPVRLAPQEAIDQTARIHEAARLIRTERYPLCPINGILVLIPFKVLTAADEAVREVQRAIKSDLTSLQETLKLKAPTVALFTGLENENGFRELVRRVGPASASRQRFGKGMDIRCAATTDELTSLSAHACGAFEDWVYTLFRETGALTRPGNTLLHSLLCTVRSQLKKPIAELLAGGFGNPSVNPGQETPFAGCYFAATGESQDQQAFVRGVFDKLTSMQEDLEWTPDAWKNSNNARKSLWIAVTCCVLLSVSLVAMLLTRP